MQRYDDVASCEVVSVSIELGVNHLPTLDGADTPTLYTPSIISRSVSAAISRMALAAVYSSDS